MIQVKDKVTHPRYGKGIVIDTRRNGQLIHVDYKGVCRWHSKQELQSQNTYHESENDKFIALIDKQITKADNEYSSEARQIAITVLKDLKLEL